MIEWKEIQELIGNKKGQVKVICPKCSHNRKKQNQKEPCLSVDIDNGAAKCWNCEEIAIRDKKEVKEYFTPSQEWHNYTQLSDKLVKWIKSERNISQQTLIDCKITEEVYYQPALQKEVNNIVFNYFEGDKLVNKKYRSPNKRFSQCKDAKKVFYGINDIIGKEEAYIVEGEFDKLALWEVGVKNCISVPNGANDLNDIFETCENYLKPLKKIYIAVDTDEQGLKLEKELLKRFGKWKCERIEFKGKDANDDLKDSPLTLEESLQNCKPYPVDGTFSAFDIKEDIFNLYDNGLNDTIKPKNSRFSVMNDSFSIMHGQLTVVTGIPSHGKSNFIEDYVLNLVADCDLKASFFSPEHFPLELHQSVMIEKVMGKPFNKDFDWQGDKNERIKKSEIEEYIEWSKDKIFLTYPEKNESVTWQWLLNKFKEQMFRYGTDIFVIDAFNKVKRDSPDSLGEINQALTDLAAFAQGYNCIVILIAHPTKMRKRDDGTYEVPDLYSVSGSADFRNQTHNGLCVYRHFQSENIDKGFVEVVNLKTKFKFQGEIGSVTRFEFDVSCNRYYPQGQKPDRSCLFKKQEIQHKLETKIEPNYDFDNTKVSDEVPF